MLQFLRGVAGVCFTLAIASANAATVTYSFANPLSTAEINQAMPLSLFDSNLGTLTGASLTVTANMDAYMTVTNRSAQTQTSKLTLMSDIGISSSLVGVNQLFDNFSDIPLSNTIGPIQFPPATSILVGPFIDQKVLTKDLSTALAELSAPGGGSFTINCTSLPGMSLAGGSNIRGDQETKVGCGATITYTYDPAPPIDLTLTKTVTSTGPYIVGSNVTYSLLARNLGLGTAQAAIVVKDLLPAGLTYVSATGTNWSCAAAGQTITCTRDAAAGTLAANASADAITVVAKIDAAVATGTSLVNYAQVAPAGNETVPESSPLGTATGGYEDGNPASGSNNDDSKAIVVAAAAAIPTLNEWMLLLLSVMLGLLAMRQAQGRRHMK